MRLLMVHPHDLYALQEPWTVRLTHLATQFHRRGHEVKVVYHLLDPHVDPQDAARRQEFPFPTVPLVRHTRTGWRKNRALRALARGADLIHFQKCFAWCSLPCLAAGWRLSVPVHYDWDDWEYEIWKCRPSDPHAGALISRVEDSLPRLVDSLSVASDALGQRALALGVRRDHMVKTPVGADLDLFDPDRHDPDAARRALGLDGEIVVYMGQLHGAQYAEQFLLAGKLLVDRGRPVTLLVVGGGEGLPALQQRAQELAIADRTIFTGMIPHHRVPEYLAAAHVAVACFDNTEQTRCKSPLKVVEYLAMGKALVATEMGEVPGMVGDAAVRVGAGRVDDLSRAVAEFLEQPEKRRLFGARARRRALASHSWAAIAAKLEGRYAAAVEDFERLYPRRRRHPFLDGASPPPPSSSAGGAGGEGPRGGGCAHPRGVPPLGAAGDGGPSDGALPISDFGAKLVDAGAGWHATSCCATAHTEHAATEITAGSEPESARTPRTQHAETSAILVSSPFGGFGGKNIPAHPSRLSRPPATAGPGWWGRAKRFLRENRDLMGVLDRRRTYVGPRIVQIDPTNLCNNDCVACWCNSPLLEEWKIPPSEKRATMSIDMLRDLIDELAALGTKEIYLAGGGDPLVHPRIMDFLEHIKRRQLVCYVNTNFLPAGEADIRRFVDLGIDDFTISAWAGSPEAYDRTHPNKRPEHFYELRDKLLTLRRFKEEFGRVRHRPDPRGRRGPRVKIYNVISNLNYTDISNMIDFTLDVDAEWVEFTVVDTMPGKTDYLLLDEAQQRELIDQCREQEARLEALGRREILYNWETWMRRIQSPGMATATYDEEFIHTFPCTVGYTFARVVATGEVHSCLKSHRLPLGSLYEQRFTALWTSQRQAEFREKTKVFRKDDPFFSLIGNDPTQACGCVKSCDDIGRNLWLWDRWERMSPGRKLLLRAGKLYCDLTGRYVEPPRPAPARAGAVRAASGTAAHAAPISTTALSELGGGIGSPAARNPSR